MSEPFKTMREVVAHLQADGEVIATLANKKYVLSVNQRGMVVDQSTLKPWFLGNCSSIYRPRKDCEP